MTDEERRMFSNRLREAHVKIERLDADLSVASANLNIAKANLDSERLINERLREELADVRADAVRLREEIEWLREVVAAAAPAP